MWPRPSAKSVPRITPASVSPLESSTVLWFAETSNPVKSLRVMKFITPAMASEP